jgi:hypothetical protein
MSTGAEAPDFRPGSSHLCEEAIREAAAEHARAPP